MFFIALVVLAGCFAALQAPVNAALSRTVGVLESGLVSFAGGTLVLALLVFCLGRGQVGRMFETPVWQWTGGLLGIFMVLSATLAIPRIGAVTTFVAMVFGNLIMAAVIDHFGWFGLTPVAFGWRRLLGLLLVFAGIILAARG